MVDFNTLKHLAPGPGSKGTSTSIMDNFGAMWEQTQRVDAEWALEAELVDMYAENLARAAEASGMDLENSIGAGPGGWQFMRDVLSLELGDTGGIPREIVEGYPWVRQFRENEQRLLELQATNPDVRTFQQLLEDVQQLRQEIMEETASVQSRGGGFGAVAGFAGGVAGSFSLRDPSLLASMFIPVGGATIARRVLLEGALGAGTELGVQYSTVQPRAGMLGEEVPNPWVSALYAGVGSAAFRGVVEGAVPAARRIGEVAQPAFRGLEEQLFPARALARAIDEAELRPSNRELIDIGLRSDSAELRAAAHSLDLQIRAREEMPYADNPVGREAASLDMQVLFGEATLLPRGTSTAVGRFMSSPQGTLFADAAQTPQQFIGRLEHPALYERFAAAELRLSEAQARVTELETQLGQRSMSDAISLIDAPSGGRVAEIEAELRQANLPSTRRAELERELDMIVESLGPSAIARAEADFRIAPKYALRDARRALRAARQAFNRVAKEVGEVEARASETFGEPVMTPTQVAEAIDGLVLREDGDLLAEAKAMVDNLRPPRVEGEAPAPRDPIPTIAGIDIPEDFVLEIDGKPMSVRQVLDDLAEDDAMVEAMRTCSL